MKLAHWNPLRELESISERLNRFLSHSKGQEKDTAQMSDRELMTAPDWYPPVDVLETDTEYYLKVELPEVNKRDVRVTLDNGMLLHQGERKEEPNDAGYRIHRLERPYGRTDDFSGALRFRIRSRWRGLRRNLKTGCCTSTCRICALPSQSH